MIIQIRRYNIPPIIFFDKNYVFIIKTMIHMSLYISTINVQDDKCPENWVYPKITVSLKFLLFYPNPKGDKRNFKLVSVQKWDTPHFFPSPK
jgi:hypothetical protein